MRKFIEELLPRILLAALVVVPLTWWGIEIALIGSVYETTDVADYGNITGNNDNKTPREFIFTFFPEALDSSFSDVTYHYTAVKGDDHAYECYLEFRIEDPEEFAEFIDTHTDAEKTAVFRYDDSFREYTISNQFEILLESAKESGGYPIDYAVIGKILYAEKEQRVIFWALGMWDGARADTTQLDTFFSRFGIDVVDYQMNAFITPSDEAQNIPYGERYGTEGP